MARRKNTRTATQKTPRTQARPRAKMPLWAVYALLALAAYLLFFRSGMPGLPGSSMPTPATTQVATALTPSSTSAATRAATSETTPATTGVGDAIRVVAPSIPSDAQTARVRHIVDGDTIEVDLNGTRHRVRYIGIDTPERTQPGYLDATNANRALVENQTIYLAREVSDTDTFDRLLRHLYLEDGTHVNATLIAQGWAQPVEYRPDINYAEAFWDLALEAAADRRGFWAGNEFNGYADGPMPYGLIARDVAIREGPADRFRVNTNAFPQTPLSIYGRTPDGDWLQVRPPSRQGGWVPADAVEMRIPVADIVLAEDIPQ